MSSEYERGFNDGFQAGMAHAFRFKEAQSDMEAYGHIPSTAEYVGPKKRKRPQKGKAKLLTTMTKKKWDKYKKGSGKKTYVEIRAQVSKTQDYKRACKRKGFK